MPEVDIWSKGEVASYLATLVKQGQVKECKHLIMRQGYTDAFYPECAKDWASRVNARNVSIDSTAYHGPSSYSWPQCPGGCPHFEVVSDFILSVSRDDIEENVNLDTAQSDGLKHEKRVATAEPTPPEKVTIPWLLKHVPVSWWLWAVGILIAAFGLGYKVATLFGLE